MAKRKKTTCRDMARSLLRMGYRVIFGKPDAATYLPEVTSEAAESEFEREASREEAVPIQRGT